MADLNANKTYLALDVGARRIGVAIAQTVNRLPKPLTVLQNTDTIFDELKQLIKSHNASGLVVGVPRGLEGQITSQTLYTKEFISNLSKMIKIPVYKQDEAVTSKQAETELNERGRPYSKADIDALAATYILDDFMQQLKIESS